MVRAVFKGTEAEAFALVAVLKRYCECAAPFGMQVKRCAIHVAFSEDQRLLDFLLDSRRRSSDLMRQEFMRDPEPE